MVCKGVLEAMRVGGKGMGHDSGVPLIGKTILVAFLFLFHSLPVQGKIITKLPTNKRLVALTFDACETKTPSYFDLTMLDFLLRNKIPFTLFISGKFAERKVNSIIITDICKYGFVEIENHSYSHPFHMERLTPKGIEREVLRTESILYSLTDKRTKFFRFPGGNWDNKSVRIVERLGYKIVHWAFVSGDPDKSISPVKLMRRVLLKTRPGSILIFHINGRGYSTGKALPVIVKVLRKRGYSFVKLEDLIDPN